MLKHLNISFDEMLKLALNNRKFWIEALDELHGEILEELAVFERVSGIQWIGPVQVQEKHICTKAFYKMAKELGCGVTQIQLSLKLWHDKEWYEDWEDVPWDLINK